MINRRFYQSINAVRLRQRIQRTLHYGTWGLLLAAFVSFFSLSVAGWIVFISFAVGWLRPLAFSSSARLVDRHYQLKDRILTTAALLRLSDRTPMEQLQVEDTAEHLKTVRSQSVLPIRIPVLFWLALALFVIDFDLIRAVFVSHLPEQPPISAAVLPFEDMETFETIVVQSEELALQHADEQTLKILSQQLETLKSKLERSKNDAKESLMTLSEMEEAFQSALDALQLETMDASLLELANVLDLAEKTLPISRLLEKKEFSQASSELKKLAAETWDELTPSERKAMEEQLQEIAAHTEERHQEALQEAIQKLAEALRESNNDLAQSATESLADEVEKHGIRQEIAKDLATMKMMLAMAKADSGDGNMDGGTGIEKTHKASETWGFGSAGDPTSGTETQLEGERQQEKLTGMVSDQGESITETKDSEGEKAEGISQREYREQFLEFKRISESVLDTEPIPLGQRQVIRRYFESIRPVD